MINTTNTGGCNKKENVKGASFSRNVNTQFNDTCVLAEFVCKGQDLGIRVVHSHQISKEYPTPGKTALVCHLLLLFMISKA